MSSAVHTQGGRPLVRLAFGSALLLVSWAEIVFGGPNSSALVAETLLGVPGAWLLFRGVRWITRAIEQADLFSPRVAFPIAYALWFGLGSLTFWEDANPPRYEYFVLGLLAYLVGVAIIPRRLESLRKPHVATEPISWNTARFRFVMLALFLLMTASYLLLIAQVGIPTLHADVAFRREELGAHHYLSAILQSSATTLMFFSAADLWSLKRALAPLVSCGMLGLAALMLSSFGNKGFLIVPFLTLLILWHYWRKAIPAGRLAILLAAVFLASVAYDYTRAVGIAEEMGGKTWDEMLYSSGAFTLHTNLSNFRDVVQAIPSEVPYQHGYLTFGVLLQILPGHHESSDEFFRRILGSDFIGGGQPGTVLGPFYGDFGVTGILIGMFLFGAFSLRAYRWMQRSPTLFRALLYSWLVQTAILSVYGALVTYIITLWLPFLWWILHRWMCSAAGTTGPLNQPVDA